MKEINFSLPLGKITKLLKSNNFWIIAVLFVTSLVSIAAFIHFYSNGLGLAYNDARSHLDIGRRVVEGLKPGIAQLGSVWLPLPHALMIPTVWNDWMWHSGLSGAIISMVSFVATAVLIYMYLKKIGIGIIGRIFAVTIFVTNLNILYLQSTAMTELLLIALMMAGSYYLLNYFLEDKIIDLVKSAFWIMLSTLARYDGWLLLAFATVLIIARAATRKGYKTAEGVFFMFCTLGGLGIVLWLLWNQLIFKDFLYFALGPYSARAQQIQLEDAGVLATKANLFFSLKTYTYALVYNIGLLPVVLGVIGAIVGFCHKKINTQAKLAMTALFAPLVFNILALYFGHSVLFVQGISGDTWFNVRYGIMLMPTAAIFCGLLIDKLVGIRALIAGLMAMFIFFAFFNADTVTIDDARVGSSQKNVTEVSGWLEQNTKNEKGFIMISVASHDAIIFSSNLPMKRFIHEGTGAYWDAAGQNPDLWARWIIMRTNDINDQTFKAIMDKPGLANYDLVGQYPFADIYQIKPQFLGQLNYEPVFKGQK